MGAACSAPVGGPEFTVGPACRLLRHHMRALAWPSARVAAWGICVLSTVATLALLGATGTSIEIGSIGVMAGLVLLFGGLHCIYTRWRPDPYIGAIAGGLTVMIWAGFVAAVAALAALRAHAPLVDGALARADAAIGLDTPALVGWLARNTPVWLLEVAYLSTVPLVFLTVVVLGGSGRAAMMWQLCLAFAGSAVSCAFLSAVTPAVGTFAHFGIPGDVLALLPADAGRFYLPTFYAYRSGTLSSVNIHHFDGVVSFPSFHAAMTLMTAYALRGMRWLFAAACVWAGLTLISTVPIGGHYAVDILAGAAVWAAFTLPQRVIGDGILKRSAGTTALRAPVRSGPASSPRRMP